MEKHNFARTLRRNSTDAEVILWNALRDRQVSHAKFRRQTPIGPYIADFCCMELKLVIELDGGQHFVGDGPAYDSARTEFLMGKGFSVRRYSNLDVLKNLDGVLQDIYEVVQEGRGGSGTRPLTLTLSPEDGGEGTEADDGGEG
jgi:very-short-patch-repair endonuclease